jgi:hypothetical protein
MIPVRAQNLSGGPLMAQVDLYTAQKAEFTLWPNATEVKPTIDKVQVTPADASPIRLTLYDANSTDAYRIAPNSKHRVVISDLTTPLNAQGEHKSVTQVVTASDKGVLTIETKGAAVGIEVAPEG